ncbi:RidA family protein [Poseidonocella sp. HB161398]|uniref:RidA family protein n=1 Tax=Poseidonocella sp. HB161398 TaxID=2320855 RepID=UPI00110838F8|nr:RidA family protein [Poseidonocella sp. HB161398]
MAGPPFPKRRRIGMTVFPADKTGAAPDGRPTEETAACPGRIRAMPEVEGPGPGNAASCTCHLADRAGFAAFNAHAPGSGDPLPLRIAAGAAPRIPAIAGA